MSWREERMEEQNRINEEKDSNTQRQETEEGVAIKKI